MSVILNSGLKSNAWASLNDSVICIVSVSCLYSCCSPNHYHRNPATATALPLTASLSPVYSPINSTCGSHSLWSFALFVMPLASLLIRPQHTPLSPCTCLFSRVFPGHQSIPPTSFMFRSSNHLRSLLHTWHCHDDYLSTGIFLLRLQVSGRQGCVFCSPLYHPVLTWHIASIQKC